MPKQLLTGTLEEQCAFLYDLAQEKMAQGNYTGAVHALKEILKYAPDYRDAAGLLNEAKRRKREQGILILVSLASAALFMAIGSLVEIGHDLWFLILAVVGAVIGFLLANLVILLRQRAMIQQPDSAGDNS